MSKGARESVAEKKFVERCRERGYLALKMEVSGWRNWPDRQILLGQGYVFFIEFKRLGEEARPAQAYRHEQLRKQGYSVYVCDTLEGAMQALETELDKWRLWL